MTTKPDFLDDSPAKFDDRVIDECEERIAFLIQLYIFDDLTEEENDELQKWVAEHEDHQRILDDATSQKTLQLGVDFMKEADVDDRLQQVKIKGKLRFTDTGAPVRVMQRHMKRWLTAACVILLAGIGIAIYLSFQDNGTNLPGEIPPGKTIATLTLSDSKVLLDPTTEDGVFEVEEDYTITKKDGQIIYTAKGPGTSVAKAPHTISTPRAGTHPVVLSDGTRMWLNPSSSVSFPPVFSTGSARRVTVSGEVFFEVATVSTAKGKTPFIVEVKDRDVKIEVLGTHFNVNAYPDETSIKTTLLEGSVRVTASGQSSMLKPGQQAEVANRKIKVVDLDESSTKAVRAWKEGYFDLKKSDIRSIFREIGRWYDMEIEYAGEIPLKEFGGQLSRNRNLNDLLKVLEVNGINCKIKGKTIIVKP